jgi:NAD+ synthase
MPDSKAAPIIANLKSFFRKADKKRAVIGLSGGVDSSLTVKLAVMALGKENVTALILPNTGINQAESVSDAENWAKELGIEYHIIPIDDYISAYKKLPWESSGFADMNIQARARANILYHYANSNDALVLGTGNKTELTLGYFTKYGDGACDILPIGGLYKTEVWEMSKELGLPEKIIKKTPSAGLAHGQTDEGEIGVKYPEIDGILRKFEAGKKPSSGNEKRLWERTMANKHKSEVPPVMDVL